MSLFLVLYWLLVRTFQLVWLVDCDAQVPTQGLTCTRHAFCHSASYVVFTNVCIFKKRILSIYFCCFSSHLACMYGCTYSMCVWEVRRQTAVPLLPREFETRTPADAFITWCLPAWLWIPGPLVFPPVYQGPGILGLPVSAQWQNACEHTWGPGFELQHHNQLIKQ